MGMERYSLDVAFQRRAQLTTDKFRSRIQTCVGQRQACQFKSRASTTWNANLTTLPREPLKSWLHDRFKRHYRFFHFQGFGRPCSSSSSSSFLAQSDISRQTVMSMTSILAVKIFVILSLLSHLSRHMQMGDLGWHLINRSRRSTATRLKYGGGGVFNSKTLPPPYQPPRDSYGEPESK